MSACILKFNHSAHVLMDDMAKYECWHEFSGICMLRNCMGPKLQAFYNLAYMVLYNTANCKLHIAISLTACMCCILFEVVSIVIMCI